MELPYKDPTVYKFITNKEFESIFLEDSEKIKYLRVNYISHHGDYEFELFYVMSDDSYKKLEFNLFDDSKNWDDFCNFTNYFEHNLQRYILSMSNVIDIEFDTNLEDGTDMFNTLHKKPDDLKNLYITTRAGGIVYIPFYKELDGLYFKCYYCSNDEYKSYKNFVFYDEEENLCKSDLLILYRV
jgi:hypothetical protein